VVQVSGGALTRTSSVAPPNQDQIQLSREIGSTQFLEQGNSPCSFFFREAVFGTLALTWLDQFNATRA
jgi:hypothetical protein